MSTLLAALGRRVACQSSTAFVRQSRIVRNGAAPNSIMVPRRSVSLLFGASNNDSEDNDFEPTWTFVPYDAKKPKPAAPRRRPFSTWSVSQTIDIPEDRLEFSFVRSSGAGGQNVNKVNTKVELRFKIDGADWIPSEVRSRLKEQQFNRINKDGFLSIQSQENRTQGQNRKTAVAKLREMLVLAWPRPKIRRQRKGVSKASKERNKDFKKKRSDTKLNRKKIDW